MRDQLFTVPDARVNFAGEGFGGGGASLNQGLYPMVVDLKVCAGQ